MDLSCDFLEAGIGIEGLADVILVEGFDLGHLHSLLLEVVERTVHQGLSDALALMSGEDGDVRNLTDQGVSEDAGRDVADDDTVLFIDEDAACIRNVDRSSICSNKLMAK